MLNGMTPLSSTDMAYVRGKSVFKYSRSSPGDTATAQSMNMEASPAMKCALQDIDAMLVIYPVANYMRSLGNKDVPIVPALWGGRSIRSNVVRDLTLACAAVDLDENMLGKLVTCLADYLTEQVWNETEAREFPAAPAVVLHAHLVDKADTYGLVLRRRLLSELGSGHR